jgi:uncharacterized membrane protein YraQ (UPF0718 family)
MWSIMPGIQIMSQAKKRKTMNMLMPTIIMAVLAAALVVLGVVRGEGEHLKGMGSAARMLIDILPLLIFAFIVAGMVQILIPHELMSRWVGEESGLKGLLIGTVAGGVMPGGPYVSLPVAAGLLKAGASLGTMVAFLTAWSLWAVSRLPMEVGIMGWRFTLIRLACTFFFPPIAGFLAQYVFSGVK